MATATTLNVPADKVMLNDVVVLAAPTPNHAPCIGTVWRLEIANDDVTIHFHGPQMEKHEAMIGSGRSISIIRLVEKEQA